VRRRRASVSVAAPGSPWPSLPLTLPPVSAPTPASRTRATKLPGPAGRARSRRSVSDPAAWTLPSVPASTSAWGPRATKLSSAAGRRRARRSVSAPRLGDLSLPLRLSLRLDLNQAGPNTSVRPPAGRPGLTCHPRVPPNGTARRRGGDTGARPAEPGDDESPAAGSAGGSLHRAARTTRDHRRRAPGSAFDSRLLGLLDSLLEASGVAEADRPRALFQPPARTWRRRAALPPYRLVRVPTRGVGSVRRLGARRARAARKTRAAPRARGRHADRSRSR